MHSTVDELQQRSNDRSSNGLELVDCRRQPHCSFSSFHFDLFRLATDDRPALAHQLVLAQSGGIASRFKRGSKHALSKGWPPTPPVLAPSDG